MRIEVRTHRGGRFFVEVKPDDKIASLKEKIEAVQGKKYYPAEKQLLSYWHRGLRDNTTFEQNKMADNAIVMVYIPQRRPAGPPLTDGVVPPPRSSSRTSVPPSTSSQPQASTVVHEISNPEQTLAAAPSASSESSTYGQAASNVVAGLGLDSTIQQILDLGGGRWDRDTVIRALSAAFNNPQRAIEYLYSEFPEQTEVPAVARDPAVGQVANPQVQAPRPAVPASGPKADPPNFSPQGLLNIGAGNLDFLHNNPQFQALRAMVQQENPQVLQSMLQELDKQNPNLMQFIQELQSEFSRLMNEPVEGKDSDSTIQQILDIGGGSWDRDTVIRALSAAFNNRERAIEILHSEFPEQTEVPAVARDPAVGRVANAQVQAPQTAVPASGPNADPVNLFPQGLPNNGAGNLDLLRNKAQFQALRALLQEENPQVLQSMLQELEKQNPNLMQFIQEHPEISRLMNEHIEGREDPAAAMAQPESVFLTPEERAAMQRLEDMGFTRERVMVVFFACNKNEQLAANYLLDHRNQFDN